MGKEDLSIFERLMITDVKGGLKKYVQRLLEENNQLEHYVNGLEKENMLLLSRCNHLQDRVSYLEELLEQR